MERSLPIFQALATTEEVEKCHWWYASLAYCLKDKIEPDFVSAVFYLDKAIEIRGPETRSGAYEFNRAFCNIKLVASQPDRLTNLSTLARIRSDLEVAKKFARFAEIIATNSTVREWMSKSEADR